MSCTYFYLLNLALLLRGYTTVELPGQRSMQHSRPDGSQELENAQQGEKSQHLHTGPMDTQPQPKEQTEVRSQAWKQHLHLAVPSHTRWKHRAQALTSEEKADTLPCAHSPGGGGAGAEDEVKAGPLLASRASGHSMGEGESFKQDLRVDGF